MMIDGVLSLPVIVLADLSNSHQSFEVLIGLVGMDVVEGAAVPWIPVGCCKVYRHLKFKTKLKSEKQETIVN